MNAVKLDDRALIRLSPEEGGDEDVRGFLQGLVTNDVSSALPVYAALLSAQGKAMFDFLVWGDGPALLVDCEAKVADDLLKRLSLYKLRRQIVIEREEKLAVYWSPERGGSNVLPGLGAAAPMISGEHVSSDPRILELGTRWLAPRGAMDCEDGAQSYRKHRLSHGVPEGVAELGDILWLETNAVELNGVSFSKGCYVGQENTARMNWRQKVNRRLVVVPLSKSEEKRRKIAYPDLGAAIDHLRVADIDPASVQPWQRAGIEAPRSS